MFSQEDQEGANADVFRDPKRIPNEERKTSARMTKFEKALIIGNRAAQLSQSAPPLVDTEDLVDCIEIALKELREKKIPFLIRRVMPNKQYELWALKEMIIEDD